MIPELEISIWFTFWGICYRLREYGPIWSKKNKPRYMNSPWWLSNRDDSEQRWYHLFKWLFDSYHFFGNLPRILASIRLTYMGYSYNMLEVRIEPMYGIIAFMSWFLFAYITKQYLLKAK